MAMTMQNEFSDQSAGASDTRAMASAIMRQDFAAFIRFAFPLVHPGQKLIDGAYIDAIAFELQKVAEGRSTRLIINLPPRYLKSFCVSVALPAFILGRDPKRKILCVSYSTELAKKFANDFRVLVDHPRFKGLFPGFRTSPLKNTELEVQTTARGYRLSVSSGGTITGRGGDIILIDDPLKAEDAMSDSIRESINDWFNSTLLSRLDDKAKGQIVLVMQRLHLHDLSGVLLHHGGWRHLCLPAIAEKDERLQISKIRFMCRRAGEALHPEREPLERLKDLERRLGPVFAAQYQQQPVPIDGNLILREHFETYQIPPERIDGDYVVLSIDTASKTGPHNDYSVIMVFLVRGSSYFLLTVLRARLEFPALKQATYSLAERHGASTVLIEDTGVGTSLISVLREEGRLAPVPIKPVGDKRERVLSQWGTLSARKVKLPTDVEWLSAFWNEVLPFPQARHDDQVDALIQFLVHIEQKRRIDSYNQELLPGPIQVGAGPRDVWSLPQW